MDVEDFMAEDSESESTEEHSDNEAADVMAPDNPYRNDKGTFSGWVHIHPLRDLIQIPHIIELVQRIRLEIDHPAKCFISNTETPFINYCRIALKSVKDAKKFIKEYDGWELDNNDGNRLKVTMVKMSRFSTHQLDDSKWLKVSNLYFNTSEQQLASHIRKQSKRVPQSVELRHHQRESDVNGTEEECPAPFALVQMKSVDDAQKVIETAQMSGLHGVKMWIKPIVRGSDDKNERNEHLKGQQRIVVIRNLPLRMNTREISRLCVDHGDVDTVQMMMDKMGYLIRCVRVEMTTVKGADAVFDAFHEMKVQGSRLETEYESVERHTNCLMLSVFPKDSTTADICEFVMQAVHEHPVRIWIDPPLEGVGFPKAFVVFSGHDVVKECMTKLRGKKMGGFTVELSEGHRLSSKKMQKSTMIKMENLARNVTEQMILNHLRKYSKITTPPKMIRLVHHPVDPDALGFAEVELQTDADAEKVVRNTRMTEMEGRKCWVQFSKPRNENRREHLEMKTERVAISNLHYKLDENKVIKICRKYGVTNEVVVPKDKKGYPTCRAYITMEKPKQAKKIFDTLHGVKVLGVPMYTAYLTPEKKKMEHLSQKGKLLGHLKMQNKLNHKGSMLLKHRLQRHEKRRNRVGKST